MIFAFKFIKSSITGIVNKIGIGIFYFIQACS